MRDLNLVGLRDAITSRIVTFANKILNSGVNSFLTIKGTLPSTPTGATFGVNVNVTSAGSVSFGQRAITASLNAGFTGASGTHAIRGDNAADGTQNVDSLAGGGNIGVGGYSTGTTTGSAGSKIGTLGYALNNGTGKAFGAVGTVHDNGSLSGVGFGVTGLINGGLGAGSAAGFFTLGGGATVIPTLPNSAVLVAADNIDGNTTFPILQIFTGRTTPTAVFTINGGGNIQVLRTVTPAGTTGAQTINKPAGTIRIAAAGTNVVLTNSLITTTSIIFATLQTNDGTAKSVNAVPAAGSCTFTLNAAATGEVAIGFLVTN